MTGVVERDGGRVSWEAYGAGEPPIVFVPPWQVVHSRTWKAQIPDFARRHRVIAWDNRGNGRSDRPRDPMVHVTRERAANLIAVMDAAGVAAAVLVGVSSSSGPMTVLGGRASGARARAGLHLSGVAVRRAVVQGIRVVRGAPAGRRRLEQGEHPLLAARLRCLPRVLLRRGVPGTALHETGRRRDRLGDGDRRGDAGCHGPHATDARRPDVHRDVCRDPRPDAGHPGHLRAGLRT